MKKLFTTSLVALSLTIASLAMASAALAESMFDGAYVGVGVGHARGKDGGSEYKQDGSSFLSITQKTTPKGNLFAGFAGANKVLQKNILVGAEADFEFRDYDHASYQEQDKTTLECCPTESRVRNAASLRAKLGYVFNGDKTLSYVTAGPAKVTIKRTYGDNNGATSLNNTTRHNGYAFGFGLEHFLTDKISLRGEYRYTHYMAKNIDTSSIYGAGTIEKQKFDDQSLRLGVAYNF